jgi:hypothetical protein
MKNANRIASDMEESSLSDEDVRVYIDIIVIGFAKIVTEQIKVAPKSRARRISNTPRFSNGFTAVLDILQHQRRNQSLRQYDIMKRLPDFFQYGKRKLRSPELSKIMQSLTRLGILEPPKIEKTEKKRGPKTIETEDISGPNKRYGPTTLKRDLNQVLSNSDALGLIHSLLQESNLLQQLMTDIKLV